VGRRPEPSTVNGRAVLYPMIGSVPDLSLQLEGTQTGRGLPALIADKGVLVGHRTRSLGHRLQGPLNLTLRRAGAQGTLKEPRQATGAEEPSWVRFTEQLGRFVSDSVFNRRVHFGVSMR
jgi:hypothetical protein